MAALEKMRKDIDLFENELRQRLLKHGKAVFLFIRMLYRVTKVYSLGLYLPRYDLCQ
ncbi:MAG: hypothetical protein ABSE80_08380 [Halobacteriota archaeon]|jgi:hypothetical protein